MTASTCDAGEHSAVNIATCQGYCAQPGKRVVWPEIERKLSLFEMEIALTPAAHSLNYFEALKDAAISKIGNFKRGADNIRTHD